MNVKVCNEYNNNLIFSYFCSYFFKKICQKGKIYL